MRSSHPRVQHGAAPRRCGRRSAPRRRHRRNVSVIGMVCGAPVRSAAVRAGAPRRLDQREPGFGADRIEKRDHARRQAAHRPPAGSADRAHGPSPRSSRPRPRPAPRVNGPQSSKGDRKCAPRASQSGPWAAASVSSKKSPVSTISTAHPPPAEGAGLEDLLLGRGHRHVDAARHPEMRADKGHALRMNCPRWRRRTPARRGWPPSTLRMALERTAQLCRTGPATDPRA